MYWSILHAVHVHACLRVNAASFDLFTGGNGTNELAGDDNPAAGGFFLKRAIVALNGFFLVRQRPNDAYQLARVWPCASSCVSNFDGVCCVCAGVGNYHGRCGIGYSLRASASSRVVVLRTTVMFFSVFSSSSFCCSYVA